MTRFVEMTIGPEEAEEMLARNYSENRKVRAKWVRELAAMMSAGSFVSQNGETVIVDESGTLYNGQHRMRAVVESGVTLTFDVAVIPDETAAAAYKTMDNGTKRNAADYVGGKYKSERAALARIGYCVDHGTAPLLTCLQGKVNGDSSPSRIDVAEYANAHADLLGKCAMEARAMREALGCGAPRALAVGPFLVRRLGDDALLDEFVAEVCDENTATPTTRAYVGAMRKGHLRDKKPAMPWVVGTFLDAYRHFLALDDSTTINKARGELAKYDKRMAKAREGRDA